MVIAGHLRVMSRYLENNGNKMVLTEDEAEENGVWDFWAGD